MVSLLPKDSRRFGICHKKPTACTSVMRCYGEIKTEREKKSPGERAWHEHVSPLYRSHFVLERA